MSIPRPYFPNRPDVVEIDPGEVERRFRDKLSQTLMSLHERRTAGSEEVELVPFERDARFTEVRLEKSFPHTEIVVLFELEGHEGVRFGARRRVWEDDGAISAIIDVFDTNLSENISNRRDDLIRQQQPDQSGIVWLYG
jgi:hypothetical protein